MSNQRYVLPTGRSLDIQTDLNLSMAPFPVESENSVLPVRLLYLTTARYGQDWSGSVHSHSFSELFYITGGKGHFLVQGKQCPVEKGHLLIVNPQIEHGEFSSEADPLEYIVLGIEGMQFINSSFQLDDMPVIHISHAEPSIAYCMNTLRDEIQHPQPGQEAICQNLLNVIILMILRQKDMQVSITAFNNVSSECLTIKNYIDSHFKDPVTLDLLAQQIHQNKYYIAHTFKDAFGISPIKYLMERRVQESKFLLDETDLSIGQIAAIVGFSSSSHYSQAFRRSTNLSPNEYRRQCRCSQKTT